MYSRKYIRPTLSASSERSERPNPPPDYRGVAFRTSDARTVQDFPETVIATADEVSEKTAYLSSDTATDRLSESVYSESERISDDLTLESPQADTTEVFLSEEEPYPESESLSEPEANGEAEPSPPSEENNEASPTEPPTSVESESASPLKWLRELKMEDFLLLWMLLMLLYGESNEEIDLLLGLLLFAGR